MGGQPVRLPESQRPGGRDGGILIVSVTEESPAQRDGLMLGDVMLAFNGRPVDDPEALLSLLTGELIDHAVPVEILRAGAVKTVDVTLAERTPPADRGR